MRPITVNVAETLIEPFWDRLASGIRKWNIKHIKQESVPKDWWDNIPDSIYSKEPIFNVKSEDGRGIWLKETWSQLEFGCEKADGTVLEMERDFNIDCSNYDTLLLCALIPPKSSLVLTAITNHGVISKRFEACEYVCKQEYILPIKGSLLMGVKLEVVFSDNNNEVEKGFFHWIMLRNSQLEKAYVRSLAVKDTNWEPWLKDASYEPQFKPFLSITADEKTIESLRENKELVQSFKDKAYQMEEPEAIISDYVNFFRDKRFIRERDYEKCFEDVEDIATAALLAKDAVLMQKAARYALSLASCQFWQDGFMCRTVGLLFDHKAFAESVCCRVISTIIDLVGEMFTNAGIQFLLRRLSEEGLANINWVVWKYSHQQEDIFSMNQVAWFSSGRLAAYAVVEKFWSRTSAYTDLAYNELCESINRIILKDGGYDEGPGYFVAVAKFAGIGLYWYARARGLSFSEVIPDNLKRTADFAECALSMDNNIAFIPVGDSHMEGSKGYSILAAMMPQSHWTTMFRTLWEKDGHQCTDLLTLQLEKSIPEEGPDYRTYISMPDWGAVSSVRELYGEKIKIFQCGGNAGANHGHFDKGSFVLQFWGETIFADPGIGSYDDYIGSSMGRIEWHNMLIPLNEGRIIDPNPQTDDVKPLTEGDHIRFYSKMDLSCCWQGIYENWERELISDQPECLIIGDTYSLEKGDGVIVNLVTPLSVKIIENQAVVYGENFYVVVTPEKGCTLALKELPRYRDMQYTRITIAKKEKEGTVNTEIRCYMNEKE